MTEKFRYDIDSLLEELEISHEETRELFEVYFTEMDECIESMYELIAKKEWIKLQKVVHNVKGISINLGVTDVFDKAVYFDFLMKTNNITDADLYIKEITELYNTAKNDIQSYFNWNNN